MRSKILILSLTAMIFFAISDVLNAAQIRQMEGDDEQSADISKQDINRIKLSGDRIRSTKFDLAELKVSQDDALGEIYIQLLRPGQTKPLNIFITSEQNFTYKLILYPKGIPAEQILIKNDSAVVSSDSEISKTTKNSYQQQIIALLKAMRNKSKLESYQISNSKKSIDLGDIEMKRITTYKGQNFIGESFILVNDSNKILNLEEKMFFKSGTRAIKIEKPNLLPNEVTEIFIVS